MGYAIHRTDERPGTGFASHIGMTATDLRFLKAEKVASPSGSLAGLELCCLGDERVGTVDGVLIDPPARCVRFYVVKLADRPIRCLLPVETPVRIDTEPRRARIDTPRAALDLEPYDPRATAPFSAEDAITVMFARPAA